METRTKHGYPVSPCDHIVRSSHALSKRAARDRWGVGDADEHHPTPPRGSVIGFAGALVLAVLAALVLIGCGGKVSAKVNPAADPKVEITWEREVRALCDLSAEDRVGEMNRVNNAHLNEMFVIVACPGIDPLNTDAQAILYNGVPAIGVQVQAIYLLPHSGEQAQSTMPSALSAAGRTPLARMEGTLP